MFDKYFQEMKKIGIIFSSGLDNNEIKKVETLYNIKFPNIYKQFLQKNLPISNGFYNWRDFSEKNISNIYEVINRPKKMLQTFWNEIDWSKNWGDIPVSENDRKVFIFNMIEKSPKIIPIYNHRYIPCVNDNPPILSIYGTDVIYYGKNLLDYFNNDFFNKELDNNLENYDYIPFWSDLME
ncbi:MAG: SMI1/KNR4 family protein [Neisseriaceae bacterium]|nr:SMI1/KNR4 family protein [Neisseriaceae bacterium]